MNRSFFIMQNQPSCLQFSVNHPENLLNIAAQLLTAAKDYRKFIFVGNLGAGKTTFIQAICKKLGVSDIVSSPTFSLVNEYTYVPLYPTDPGCVHHLDLYRLANPQEALEIGIEEYLYDACYTFIEWPERIMEFLPPDCVEIRLELTDVSTRKIVILLPEVS